VESVLETKGSRCFLRTPADTDERHSRVGRFIGQQVSALVEWQATEHLSVAATYVHFTPGNALKQAGGCAGEFVAAWEQYRF
jgi:hypothetical protein